METITPRYDPQPAVDHALWWMPRPEAPETPALSVHQFVERRTTVRNSMPPPRSRGQFAIREPFHQAVVISGSYRTVLPIVLFGGGNYLAAQRFRKPVDAPRQEVAHRHRRHEIVSTPNAAIISTFEAITVDLVDVQCPTDDQVAGAEGSMRIHLVTAGLQLDRFPLCEDGSYRCFELACHRSPAGVVGRGFPRDIAASGVWFTVIDLNMRRSPTSSGERALSANP
ncbi:hypothetical protein ACQPZ2_11365 [Nocardia pseudovaccinii]|uniref:hypothetical protein n=1 Tax=Nocardia pseudovaccinii TaxID=189540 RepID=UPI003D94F1EE